jgi:hypothetical protein
MLAPSAPFEYGVPGVSDGRVAPFVFNAWPGRGVPFGEFDEFDELAPALLEELSKEKDSPFF